MRLGELPTGEDTRYTRYQYTYKNTSTAHMKGLHTSGATRKTLSKDALTSRRGRAGSQIPHRAPSQFTISASSSSSSAAGATMLASASKMPSLLSALTSWKRLSPLEYRPL